MIFHQTFMKSSSKCIVKKNPTITLLGTMSERVCSRQFVTSYASSTWTKHSRTTDSLKRYGTGIYLANNKTTICMDANIKNRSEQHSSSQKSVKDVGFLLKIHTSYNQLNHTQTPILLPPADQKITPGT